jgi:hypothetical protein
MVEQTKVMRSEREVYEELLQVMGSIETQIPVEEKIRKLYTVEKLLQYEQDKWDTLWNYLQEKLKPQENK